MVTVADLDDDGDSDVEIRRVQPYEARRRYVCPGCNGPIEVGVGHVVVVPVSATDLRRHWHAACWDHRVRRRPGRPTSR
jgi:hypothetical protein